MAYRNPLHPQVYQSRISTYSTLTRALGDFTPPQRRRRVLDLPSQSPSASPSRSMGNTSSTIAPILGVTFDMVNYAGLGLPVAELAYQSEQALALMMVNPHEPINVEGSNITKLQISVSPLICFGGLVVADTVHNSGLGSKHLAPLGIVFPCLSTASPSRGSSLLLQLPTRSCLSLQSVTRFLGLLFCNNLWVSQNIRRAPVSPSFQQQSRNVNDGIDFEHLWLVGLDTWAGGFTRPDLYLEFNPSTG